MKKLRDPDGNCRLLKSVRTTYVNINTMQRRDYNEFLFHIKNNLEHEILADERKM